MGVTEVREYLKRWKRDNDILEFEQSSATVDLAAQNVTILTKDEADEDAIRQAIRDAGYLPLRTTSKV